ncbi:MAG: serine/threonine protein kinase [Deltaproteobacteria bacterium]|nr:serine/threonine protein kinase [Deltaproteobacteria bacterium]
MKSCPTCQRRYIDSEATCPLDDAELRPSPGETPPSLGKELGAYRLVCLLGEGGMGNIYVARHTSLNRYVAVKVLRRELASKKEAVSRFFQEANTINRLHHPNIVESIDLVEDVVDGAYCVLELLRGPDLKTRLNQDEIPTALVLSIGAQIADALGAVHALGIVHRDLKPENLILVKGEVVKLIDFGVAQIGQQGGALGTAAYMAPEQAAGRPVDGRADVYSLGVLLFEMITGRHPFASETDAEYLVRHAEETPPRPGKLAPRCPPALEACILRCLEKDPKDRYPDAATVAKVLRAVDPNARTSRGGAGKVVAGLVIIAAAAAGAFYVATHRPGETANATPAPAAAPVVVAKEPATAPAPAAPSTPAVVSIDVVSTPAGAKAYRLGETVPLGTTPFTVDLPRSDTPIEIRFELAGYEPKEVQVPIAASMQIDVTLARMAQKPTVAVDHKNVTAPDKPKASKVQREGVMDPFAP